MSFLYVLMGKSATGKDHIYRDLLREVPLEPVVMYTTRPMRDGETEGVQYHFVDRETLQALLEAGKVIERRTYETVFGPWDYFTVDDGQIRRDGKDRILIGTLEVYEKLREYFGEDFVRPIYIETEDGLRLEHAMKRERKQNPPRYDEMCRRFLADQEDFSEEKLRELGITKRFENNGTLEDCVARIREELFK
ncbi:MAG: guanylate kinase [Lachnospiraceae bacterium]|nr:guanylate kinase [Lachnospiraceae bacterium]